MRELLTAAVQSKESDDLKYLAEMENSRSQLQQLEGLIVFLTLPFARLLFQPFLNQWWWRGVVVNTLVVINEVTLRRARLVLGWVTVCGWIDHLGM